MKKGLWLAAKRGTYEEFAGLYEGSGEDPTALLIPSLTHKDPQVRFDIANRLLDDGAQASEAEKMDGLSTLHVLFGHRRKSHNIGLEVPLLRRLLDVGADVNFHAPRLGFPLETLSSVAMSDEELAPVYDVLFSRDDIDLSLPVDGALEIDLGEKLINSTRFDLARRVKNYARG